MTAIPDRPIPFTLTPKAYAAARHRHPGRRARPRRVGL